MIKKGAAAAVLCLWVTVLGALFVSLNYLKTEVLPSGEHDSPECAIVSKIISGALRGTETFYDSLRRHRVPAEAIKTVIGSLSELIDFRRCKPGVQYEIELSPAGDVVRCRYSVSPVEVYTLKKEKDNYSVYAEDVEIERHIVKLSGEITSSLFESFGESGEDDRLILAFAEIFASDIDFNTEPQPGDRFSMIFEKYFKGDQLVGYGHILAARYETASDTYEAYYHARPGEKGAYYDTQGKSLGKHFLRSPVPFSRLTSGFSRSRRHPVLGINRPHLGIDLAAPTGTPVLAAADGVVVFSGRRGGYGNQVVLNHPGGYETYYGHLSRFARGIKAGASVKQRETIGFVGATGLATGPHLDYRIKAKGAFRNPFSLRFRPKMVLRERSLGRFLARKEELSDIIGMAAPRYEKSLGSCKASQVSLI
ncbi:MAG: M23 family metallopeptidase [Desulfovibrionales bacterium]|nr:M23 family metallopeptidase [Desulfovibrionales bacterium]